jgi:hypothetical protein
MIEWILNHLELLRPYFERVAILLVIAAALPLVLGALARALVFRKDDDQKKGSAGEQMTLEMLLGSETETETDQPPSDFPTVVMLVPVPERTTRSQGGSTPSSAT